MDHLRVLIVAHDQPARAGLAALLAQSPGLVVAGQVSGDTGLNRRCRQPNLGVRRYRSRRGK